MRILKSTQCTASNINNVHFLRFRNRWIPSHWNQWYPLSFTPFYPCATNRDHPISSLSCQRTSYTGFLPLWGIPRIPPSSSKSRYTESLQLQLLWNNCSTDWPAFRYKLSPPNLFPRNLHEYLTPRRHSEEYVHLTVGFCPELQQTLHPRNSLKSRLTHSRL